MFPKRKWFFAATVFFAMCGPASTQSSSGNAGGVPRASTLPATCSVGDVLSLTTAPYGIYQATSSTPCTWVLSGGATPHYTFTSRSVSGCPMFPDQSIFNTDISQAPRDDYATQYYFGANYSISTGTYDARTHKITLTIATGGERANPTDGLAVGLRVFVTNTSPNGYNGYVSCDRGGRTWTDATGFGRSLCDVDPRVTITDLTATTISYMAANGNPGQYSSGGHVSTGPYGGLRVSSAPSWQLNLATNATPAYQMAVPGSPPLAFSAANSSDAVLYPVSNSSKIESWRADGSSALVGDGPCTEDCHVVTLNTDTCMLTEIFGMQAPIIGKPLALQGSVWNLRSDDMRSARITDPDQSMGPLNGADAADLPLYPLTLLRSEVLGADPIRHMIRSTVHNTQSAFVWPATHFASHNQLYNMPRMGEILRLRAGYNKATCLNGTNAGQPIPAYAQRVLTALQHYGTVIADNGGEGALFLSTTSDFTDAENTDLAGWLHCVLMEDLEVVNASGLQRAGNSFDVQSFVPQPAPAKPVEVALVTTPAGLNLTVDGQTCTSPCSASWGSGTSHTITAADQGSGGKRQAFQAWSDAGPSSHAVSVTDPKTLSATFQTQYLLTATTTSGGTIELSPTSRTGYYAPGTVVTVAAAPSGDASFLGFSGDLSGTAARQAITMDGPRSVTARFRNLTQWTHYKTVTVNHAQVSGTESNFAVLVSRTDTDLKAAARADAADVLFTTIDGDVLPFEIESYSPASGTIIAWVRLPSVNNSTDVSFRMYYGSPASTVSFATPERVWDAAFVAVWHLSNGTALSGADSTANGNAGSVAGATAAAGMIDGGASILASKSAMVQRTAARGLPTGAGAFTISGWQKSSAVANGEILGQFGDLPPSTVAGAIRGLLCFRNHYYFWGNNADWDTGITFDTDGAWHSWGVTWDGRTMTFYRDGVSRAKHAGLTATAATGTYITVGSSFDALPAAVVDEFRISSAALSAERIATEYANQSAPGTFLRFGAQQ